jgi:phosphate transport system permease protein
MNGEGAYGESGAVNGEGPKGEAGPVNGIGTSGGGGGLEWGAVDRSRAAKARAFELAALTAVLVGVLALAMILGDLLLDGARHLSTQFFSNYASRFPERAGIRAPLVGTLWILGLTGLMAVPVSVGAAIYLEEYAPLNWMTRLVRTNIATLAGVPSIVYGILGLALFVRTLGLGRSVLSGALTLSLLIMPIIILTAQEAIRAVPREVREGAYALGATRWQVVRHQVLPLALPGIVSGAILAVSRAMGETAPLIMIGAMSFMAFTPASLGDPFTALPIQIFHWVSRPQEEFKGLAAAAILVLMALVLTMNAAAFVIRSRSRLEE